MKCILVVLCILGARLSLLAGIPHDTLYQLESKVFGGNRTFEVHLPKHFDSTEQLPVFVVFDAQWKPYFHLVAATVDYLTEIRALPKSIVIGIHQEDRQYELTPAPVNEDWQVPSLGGAALLEDHLQNEVFPFLKETYHPSSFRVGIGHSLGGTFVLNSMIDCPNLFHSVIAISPNLEIDEEEISLKMARNSERLRQTNAFVYTTMGNKGYPDLQFLPPILRLDSVMTTLSNEQFRWQFRTLDGYDHATTPLESIHAGLLMLGSNWQITETEMNQIVAAKNVVDAFDGFFHDLSSWTRYEVKPTQNNYSQLIAILKEHKAPQQSLEVAKQAITHYPSVSIFYNDAADSCMKLGQNDEAKKYLREAIQCIEHEAFENEAYKAYLIELYQTNLKQLEMK